MQQKCLQYTIEKGKNPREENKNIQRLFETYAENINVVSHKEATIKKLSDSEKRLLEKEKHLKREVERLTEINKKLIEEF